MALGEEGLTKRPMPDAPNEFQRWLLQARRGGGVVWRIAIVSPFNTPELMLAAASSDRDATAVLRQIERVLRRLNKISHPNKRAPKCLFCPAVLWRRRQPDAIVMISPDLNDPQVACTFVCPDCCSNFVDGAALNKAIMEYYPGLRVVPTFPAGHA